MKGYIVSGGWLANKLFIFANFIAWAEEHKIEISFPSFKKYAHFFITSSHIYNPNISSQNKNVNKPSSKFSLFLVDLGYRIARICFRLKLNNNIVSCYYLDHGKELLMDDQHFSQMKKSKVAFFQGWLFRVPTEIFQKHKNKVKEHFQITRNNAETIDRILNPLFGPNNLIIGVHIRQGDYKTFENGKYYYSKDIYNKQMQQIILLFASKNVKFLICSDEKQYEKDFPGLEVFISNEHYITDLYILSRCNFIIGPPSSFSMWASFYGNVPLCLIENEEMKITTEDFKIRL
ncbi:MAG: alpha-1,2-fucosyltransferase [Bacteroidetes bacterium]|nr:alpha-1,2-fucosyltransferase [Bacteroidota bacterium]